jgi:hypothetical protein
MAGWRDHVSAAKSSAPTLNMGVGVAMTPQTKVPTTLMGWRDHIDDSAAAAMDIRKHIGAQMGSALTDDPDHQAAIAGAVTNILGK